MFAKGMVYRTAGTVRGAFWVTAFAVIATVLAVIPGTTQVVGLIFFAPFWLWAVRLWRAGVRVGGEGIVVCGVVASKRIAWAEIDRFEIQPRGRWPFVGFIVFRDGRRPLPVSSLSTPGQPKSRWPEFREQVAVQVSALNAILAEHCEANPQTPR